MNILSLSLLFIFYSSSLFLSLSLSFVSLFLNPTILSTASHYIHPPILEPPHPPTIIATSHQPDLPQPQKTAKKNKKNLNVTQKPHCDHWTISERKKTIVGPSNHRQTIAIGREKWELVRIKIYIYFYNPATMSCYQYQLTVTQY